MTINIWASYPIVRNFSRSSYGAGRQNWAIAQDDLGRLYFGNSSGLITYNSSDWESYILDNASTVRTICIDKNRIYVGGSEDFGYFDLTEYSSHSAKYHSLLGESKQSELNFKEIWNIHRQGTTMWFQGDFKIFRKDEGGGIISINADDKITTSSLIEDKLYVALQNQGLFQLQGRYLVKTPNTDELNGQRIADILPIQNNRILIATEFNGLYTFDGSRLTKLITPVDNFIKENQLFCAAIKGHKLAIGTVNLGVVILDLNDINAEPQYANTYTGMQNNTVLSLFFDELDNLWCGLDNGIDYIVTNSPFSNLIGAAGDYGAGYASLLHGSTLYLGTNQGLYAMPYPTEAIPRPNRLHRVLSGQVWSIADINGDIFICNDTGLYILRNNSTDKIAGLPGTWHIEALKAHEGYAVASTYDEFYLLQSENGKWKSKGKIKGYSDINGNFVVDGNYIWISHWMKGIYRLHFDLESKSFNESKFFDTSRGLPANNNNTIRWIGKELIMSTEGGFYQYDKSKDTIVRNSHYSDMFNSPRASHLYISGNRDIWSVSPDQITVARLNASGSREIDAATYRPLSDKIIPGFDNLNFITSKRVIASTQDGFYNIDLSLSTLPSKSPLLIINRVYANQDSIIYHANSESQLTETKIPYSLNSLRLEYALMEYREEGAVKYSTYLENYDNDWTTYSTASSKEYTQLHEGTYTFHVRAIDSYTGQEYETVFDFEIMPPWYRSTIAKCVYAILFILLAFIGFRLIMYSSKRASEKVARHKEEEIEAMRRQAQEETLRKDYQIAYLKGRELEQDIKHKSAELSNLTMNVVRKNEILMDIVGKLAKMQRSAETHNPGSEIISQLEKLQTMIKDSISHDDDLRAFTHNFDAVYEDFTKRLIAKHPDLSQTELKVCCYLKMGLSSKDMAPLFNISYHSVEMTRYRLRKKMALTRDVNLTEYLQQV